MVPAFTARRSAQIWIPSADAASAIVTSFSVGGGVVWTGMVPPLIEEALICHIISELASEIYAGYFSLDGNLVGFDGSRL